MSLSRRTVLTALAAESDAERRKTTTVQALATSLEAPEATVEAELTGLAASELAQTTADGDVRVTITGEQLLALDADGTVIVDAAPVGSES